MKPLWLGVRTILLQPDPKSLTNTLYHKIVINAMQCTTSLGSLPNALPTVSILSATYEQRKNAPQVDSYGESLPATPRVQGMHAPNARAPEHNPCLSVTFVGNHLKVQAVERQS